MMTKQFYYNKGDVVTINEKDWTVKDFADQFWNPMWNSLEDVHNHFQTLQQERRNWTDVWDLVPVTKKAVKARVIKPGEEGAGDEGIAEQDVAPEEEVEDDESGVIEEDVAQEEAFRNIEDDIDADKKIAEIYDQQQREVMDDSSESDMSQLSVGNALTAGTLNAAETAALRERL